MPIDAQVLVNVDFQPLGADEHVGGPDPDPPLEVVAEAGIQNGAPPEDPANPANPANPVAYNDDDVELLPSFIYTPNGVYEVPDKYIARDHDEAMYVRQQVWRKTRKEHRALSAATFLQGCQLTASNIVCVADPEPRSDEDCKRKVLWCVRLAINGGNAAFESPFGTSFLWQLPHGVSMFIAMTLEEFERDNFVDDADGTLLLRSLACSHHDFNPAEWPAFTSVGKIDNYYDSVFAMACAPCCKPLRSWSEAEAPRRKSFARPITLQPIGKCAFFDSTTAPDDAMDSIMETAAQMLVNSCHENDFESLLNLRLVSRSWRDAVDGVATNHYKTVLQLVKRAARGGAVPDIVAARDKALGSGLPVLAMIQDSAHPVGMKNYMRVKSAKHPGTWPPAFPNVCTDSPREENSWQSDMHGIARDDLSNCAPNVHVMEHAPIDVADAL